MIISKTPYRIPWSGGGTDHKFYYSLKGGDLISIAIKEYVYVFLNERNISRDYLIQTTSTQFANKINNIDHDLIRECLKYFKIKKYLQIGTYTTVPTKTGLGSSSAMFVGLINCIYKYLNKKANKIKIITEAFKIEREICGIQGGWQDQIISTYGGIQRINIKKNGEFTTQKIKIDANKRRDLQKKLFLIYSHSKRESSEVIKSQEINKKKIIIYYDQIKSFNKNAANFLKKNSKIDIGNLFNEHWEIKKKLSNKITNKKIDRLYLQCKNHISGGKLIGAGGGGFILAYTDHPEKFVKFLKKKSIDYIKFELDDYGSRIINV